MGIDVAGKVFFGFYEYTEEDSNEDAIAPLLELLKEESDDLDDEGNDPVYERYKLLTDDMDLRGLDYGHSGSFYETDYSTTYVCVKGFDFRADWGECTSLGPMVLDIEAKAKYVNGIEALEKFIDDYNLPQEYKQRIEWWLTSYYG